MAAARSRLRGRALAGAVLTGLLGMGGSGAMLVAGSQVAAEDAEGRRERRDLDRALVDAVLSGDPGRVRSALERGADPDWVDERSWTALTYAATGGQAEIADLLIAAGADVNARAGDGSTPLMAAAVMGHSDIARSLLAGGADPALRNDSGADARVKARQYGHMDLLRLFEAVAGSPPAGASTGTDVPSRPLPAEPATAADTAPEPDLAPEPERETTAGTAPERAPSSFPSPSAEAGEVEDADPAPPRDPSTKLPSAEAMDPLSGDYWVLRDAMVRADARQTSDGLDALPAGRRVRVVGRIRDWYRVEYDDRAGWVYHTLLEADAARAERASRRALLEAADGQVSPLVLASGRWASSDNPFMCRRDFLEVRFVDERLTLTVHAAGRSTVLAEGLPILEMEPGRIRAGRPDLVWTLSVRPDELRYQLGSSQTKTFRRCPES